MTETDFQTQVLKELKEMKGDVFEIKGNVSEMKGDIKTLDGKFNRLDDRLDSVESNLSQEIKMQGAYLNQAFDRMNFLNQQANSSPSFK